MNHDLNLTRNVDFVSFKSGSNFVILGLLSFVWGIETFSYEVWKKYVQSLS